MLLPIKMRTAIKYNPKPSVTYWIFLHQTANITANLHKIQSWTSFCSVIYMSTHRVWHTPQIFPRLLTRKITQVIRDLEKLKLLHTLLRCIFFSLLASVGYLCIVIDLIWLGIVMIFLFRTCNLTRKSILASHCYTATVCDLLQS